jgi:hypothetical protein
MTAVLPIVAPLPPIVPGTSVTPPGSTAPEWHDLRLFGRGRHPVNFEAGRERIGEL